MKELDYLDFHSSLCLMSACMRWKRDRDCQLASINEIDLSVDALDTLELDVVLDVDREHELTLDQIFNGTSPFTNGRNVRAVLES